MPTAETHKPRKGDGKRWEQPIAGRGASAALIPALRAATISPRRRCCVRPPGTAESHSLRLVDRMGKCSPMFAYVRLMGEKMLRALREAVGGGKEGRRKNGE